MCQNRYLTTIWRDLIKFLIRNCTIFILKPSIYTIHLDRMNRCAKQFFTNNKIELISNNEGSKDRLVYVYRVYLQGVSYTIHKMHVGQRNLKIDGKVSRISGAVAMPERERELQFKVKFSVSEREKGDGRAVINKEGGIHVA